ncbi:hypothetical protein KAF25_006290 [Fusarium avenaceum]|uniref:Uncharacterized protein n=1 Tax=Fusarium avenaceum TaxID=40199 RepID=A0A9P7KWD5_9HYPO|nr:hypothetical protein KAF25_006290 [Fusarium avenaceum]
MWRVPEQTATRSRAALWEVINPRADLLNAVVVASRNTQQKTVASHGNAMCALSEATRKPHVPSAFAANVVNGVTLVLIVLKYGVVVVIRLGIRTKPAKGIKAADRPLPPRIAFKVENNDFPQVAQSASASRDQAVKSDPEDWDRIVKPEPEW